MLIQKDGGGSFLFSLLFFSSTAGVDGFNSHQCLLRQCTGCGMHLNVYREALLITML